MGQIAGCSRSHLFSGTGARRSRVAAQVRRASARWMCPPMTARATSTTTLLWGGSRKPGRVVAFQACPALPHRRASSVTTWTAADGCLTITRKPARATHTLAVTTPPRATALKTDGNARGTPQASTEKLTAENSRAAIRVLQQCATTILIVTARITSRTAVVVGGITGLAQPARR